MKYKKFSPEIWSQIKNTTKELKAKNIENANSSPLVASFDADGTLWDTDLGENFFQYTINQRLVDLPPSPWEHYLEMKKLNNDPRPAYLWLAQIYKGLNIDVVKKWSQEAIESIQPLPLFQEQQDLISFFKDEGISIYIITASIKWAVEPGARLLGLSESQVLGVKTKVNNLIISDEVDGTITYKEGKSEALKQTTGHSAFFASGNSEGDLNLLESSTHLKLAVSAANRDDKLFKTEFRLQQIAEQNNWLHHRFI